MTTANVTGLKVLAIDDEGLVLIGTVAMLQELGHSVVEAFSAEQALELLASGNFDLVVTDHRMLKMTGMEMAAEIASLYPSLPVLFATGHAWTRDEQVLAPPTISKPFTAAQLDAAISSLLHKARHP